MVDDRNRDKEAADTARNEAPSSDGFLSNAIRRTDNDFHGRRNGEDLIGRDIPVEVQDREAEEAEEEEAR